MALNGLAPVIIFKLYKQNPVWKAGETSDSSLIGKEISLKDWQNMPEWKKLLYHAPIPIPIYLDERLTEIACDESDQSIDFEVKNIGTNTYQTDIGSDVTISLVGTTDNAVLMTLLSVIKQITGLLSTQRYSVTLYYNSIFVLDGLIKHISQSTVPNTNRKLVQLILSERPIKTDEGTTTKNPVDNIVGDKDGFLNNL